ncbi:ABC transporter permease [Allokutzneria sp. NRRL B-24872]|uniref:ABC transporter permease n=1 Tax=Allokutzneria sp. NRRL B-24872 TaxID=1137961 RepID=UPI001AEF6A1B|nr:ABC transporter permease subunit [Allokutzneria sp. NRRL B-24872]
MIIRITLRALLGRRRALLLLPIPVLLIGLTAFAGSTNVPVERWAPMLLNGMGLGVLLPLTALIVGSSALGLEIEDGTITHILTKPLPRWEIILSKLVVAWLVTTVAAGVPLGAAGVIADSTQLGWGLFAGAAVGALAYSALFLALSVVSRRPVIIGMSYILIWENLLGTYVEGTKVLSVRQFSSTITDTLTGSLILKSSLSVTTAVVMAGVFVILATALATRRLRSFSLAGDTN